VRSGDHCFFEFPKDVSTFGIDKSFLIGPALLASPVLEQGATSVQQYFPAAYWYNWHTGAQVASATQGTTLTLQAPINQPINLHIRGGYIVPSQKGGLTTFAARQTPYTIVVALAGAQSAAAGQLFLDDGDSLETISTGNYTTIDYVVQGATFSAKVSGTYVGAATSTYEKVVFYGFTSAVTSVRLNGQTTAFSYDSAVKKLTVTGVNGLALNKAVTIQWS